VKTRILLLILILLASVAVWYGLQFKSGTAVSSIACADITRGCGNQELEVRFDRVPQVMKPFRLDLAAADAVEAYASFGMQGMEMGLNRYRLLKQPDGSWRANVTLPVCVRGRSDWMLELEIEKTGNRQRYQIPFSAN